MEEELLSLEEIRIVEEEARNPKYSQPNLLHLGKNKLSIFRVSSSTGLILINGNQWTGREHIDLRHNPSIRKPYWKETGKLDNQSKFHHALPPIRYLVVADLIYKPENLRPEKNNRPEVFDLYIGTAELHNLPKTEYKLVTYKDSKIIHSFYVSSNKKPFNKKKILDLRQGWASSTYDPMNGLDTYEIPYFDQGNTERFKIILKTDHFSATDNWFVQVNLEDGTPFLTTGVRSDQISSTLEFPFRSIQLNFSNLTWIEKLIKQMQEEKYEY
tara:strand:- start:1829 stop:2641 length:813 start_codon:yes stop_codon:yes gene_type:complete